MLVINNSKNQKNNILQKIGIILWTFLNENVLMKIRGKFFKNFKRRFKELFEKYDRINCEKKLRTFG